MMAGQPVSMHKYEVRVQKGVEQTDGDPEKSFADTGMGRTCNNALAESNRMDTDKASIYRHPLFPLLALLFEKCEQSTQSSECVTSASFDIDIQNFVHNQEKDAKAFFSEDAELDNLMVKAIQVLRIHLLELEKVSDLCKDFCSRYISCLRSKMNSETLLSGETDGPYSPLHTQGTQGTVVPSSPMQQGNLSAISQSQMISGGAVYQPVTVVTPQGHVMTQTISPSKIHNQSSQQLQLQMNQDLGFFCNEDSSSKNKRGVLPKQATNIMRSWLFQHIAHPYPTEDEKKQIAHQTNLTLLQVNNWFINARRRILQPMLDASSSEMPKSKKKTPQTRPLQRFWPDSIASSVSPQQFSMEHGTDLNIIAVGMSMDGYQTLSSDGATIAMQQVMMGNHSEDESDVSEDDGDTHLSSANMTDLGLNSSN
ncbi:homeobox protein PKNOX1.1 isoform X1 [Clarias gariepinus]|uniref:homeobox protein PKNOX1.1 isoform X1 n=1 Tax=Clarias gariepinus TaxID=13013 RepID=UPI00234C9573|nr:homeobox protein PKNOX1.1 isoform X1 [Clarias gariepinus]XP_053352503.1 homeobox protein PKNOX1.1 isoform X1 [Clarias gariepinus]XP_053352504.1 homeobox protein PKNOX1.1 isoform X1 [Clarias gariepinus]